MDVLVLYAACAVGTLFPLLNPELTAIGVALRGESAPVLLALAGAAGQTTAFWILYEFGAALTARWKALHKLVERVRARFAFHLEERFLVLAAFAGSVGIPPAVALCALANGFGVPRRHLFPIVFAGRVARFLALTIFAREFAAWFGVDAH